MADKELVYGVRLDAAQAQAQAAQLRALFQQELQSLSFSLLDPGTLSSALSSTQAIRAQYQQIAQDAQAATQALQNAGSSSATQTRAAYDQIAQDAAAAARSMQQAAAQKPQAPIGGGQPTGGLGGLGNAVLGGVAGYFTVQGAQMIARQATEFAELGTQVRRTEDSFKILSGSAAEASARIASIKAAGGGAIDTLQAMQLANQAVSLHLAQTSAEFGNLVKAGREIALVSPVIHDVQSAVSELGLASANLSFRRLDQLGLNTAEVKDKMRELQGANASLDDSQAFLAASIDVLEAKYGKLLDTTEAQASGVEKLKVAISDLWAEMAKGPVGKGVDNVIGGVAGALNEARAYAGSKDTGVLDSELNNVLAKAKKNADDLKNVPYFGSASSGQLAGMEAFKRIFDQVNAGVAAGIPIAAEYQKQVDEIVISIIRKNQISDEELQRTHQIQTEYASAAAAQRAQIAAQQAATQQSATKNARQDRVDSLLEPVTKLGNNLKDIGLDNFFASLQEGLAKSAELTANETNRVAELRAELVGIGKAVDESGGTITGGQQQRVAAINAQIEALTQAAKLNQELQAGTPAAGQDLPAIYERLDAIIAQAGNTMTEVADKARAMGNAIAESGQASPVQQGMIDALAAQADQVDFSRVTQSLQELNQGSLDAVPGVSSLRDELAGFYDTLASGEGLTDAQAATLAGLAAQADALGGSTSALAGIQEQLGYKFLESHDYVASLVEQVANLEALYGSGAIGADQFAGGMSVLTASLYAQLDAAGALTPKLRELLALLGAVGSAKVAPGQVGGGIYTGQGPAPGLSPSFVAGQRQAEAAAAIARSKADSIARSEALAAQKKAASGAQNAFEHAASATEKAFEAVASNLEKSLEKVDGLLSNSKVTAEDMAAAKAGTYVPKADELRRQVDSAAENPDDRNRFAAQIQAAKEALNKVGIKASDDIKVLAQQLDAAWNDNSLFANKDNLKLINADAVKASIDLQTKAKEGRQNILDYFGATIDGVKAQFKAGNPEIVGAVAAELGASNDKNLQAMADQLKSGGQQIIDKVLSLAQASIDKAVGSLGSGGGGGGGGITVPTVNVGPAAGGAAGASGGAGDFLAQFDSATIQAGLAQKGADMSATVQDAFIGIKTYKDMAAPFIEELGSQFGNAASLKGYTSIGAGASAKVQDAFIAIATYQDMAAAFLEELGSQFGNAASLTGYTNIGKGASGKIQDAFVAVETYQDMAGAFNKALSGQFDGTSVNYDAMGDTLSYFIESGFIGRTDRLDMASSFTAALAEQFKTQDYSSITKQIQDSINNSGLDKEQESADGKVRKKPAMDFTATAAQITAGLSRAMGGQTALLSGIGDTASTYIGFGMTDHDFSGTAASLIGSLTSSFTTDQARTQLIAAGSALSGAIFAGFESSLAFQPWVSSIVAIVVSQAVTSLNDSLQDGLKSQALGF